MVKTNPKKCHFSFFCVFQPLNPIFGKFPKKWQIEHNGTETIDRLSEFGQENYKKLTIFMQIGFSQVKTHKGCFWLFLAIFGPFGHPQIEPKRYSKAHKWTGHMAWYEGLKKSPITNQLAQSNRRNGQNQPKKCHFSFFCVFQPLNPIFCRFPKKWQIEPNGTETANRLSEFGQVNCKKLAMFMQIGFSQVKTKKRVFLAIFGPFRPFWHP